MANDPFINEFQQALNECPPINGKTELQDCIFAFGQAARLYTIPSRYIKAEDPFKAATEALILTALGTPANWQSSFDTPVSAGAAAFISPPPPFEIKGQENAEVMSTVANYPNGEPTITRAGEYETFTFSFYGMSVKNEIALSKLKGTRQHFLIVDKYGVVVGKDVGTAATANDTVFFRAAMINVSNRTKTAENDPLGDVIKVTLSIELEEMRGFRRYTQAQAFALSVIPTP